MMLSTEKRKSATMKSSTMSSPVQGSADSTTRASPRVVGTSSCIASRAARRAPTTKVRIPLEGFRVADIAPECMPGN